MEGDTENTQPKEETQEEVEESPAEKKIENPPLPPIFDYDFSKNATDKPWKNPINDITDYFNYGYNEETWKMYVQKVKKVHEKIKVQPNLGKTSLWLDATFPVEFGGFGKPFNKELEKYETINLFLNQPEMFFHYMNYAENIPHDRFAMFLQYHAFSKDVAKHYLNILKQFYETEKIELSEGFDPKMLINNKMGMLVSDTVKDVYLNNKKYSCLDFENITKITNKPVFFESVLKKKSQTKLEKTHENHRDIKPN